MAELTQERLHELLEYDLETGIFRWKVSRGRAKKGSVAGSIHKGTRNSKYLHIRIDRKGYKAHRLAWLYVHGYFPENLIDHIDGNPLNNKLENLREASPVCNVQNSKMKKNNTSGIPGVYFCKQRNKYKARMTIYGKEQYLGYSESLLEAGLMRFTVEQQCPKWSCSNVNSTYKAICRVWPEFADIYKGLECGVE